MRIPLRVRWHCNQLTRTRSLTLLSRVLLLIADALVVGFTLAITYRSQDVAQDVLCVYGRAETLLSVIYKNGTIYFLALTAMNVLYLAFYTPLFAGGDVASNPLIFLADFINTIYDTLTAILTTDFLIRLRKPHMRPRTSRTAG